MAGNTIGCRGDVRRWLLDQCAFEDCRGAVVAIEACRRDQRMFRRTENDGVE